MLALDVFNLGDYDIVLAKKRGMYIVLTSDLMPSTWAMNFI